MFGEFSVGLVIVLGLVLAGLSARGLGFTLYWTSGFLISWFQRHADYSAEQYNQ